MDEEIIGRLGESGVPIGWTRRVLEGLRAEGFDIYRPGDCAEIVLVVNDLGATEERTAIAGACHDEGPYWAADPGTYRLVPAERGGGVMGESDWEKLAKAVEWAGTRGRDPWGHGERILAAARWALEAHKRGQQVEVDHTRPSPQIADGTYLLIPLDSEEGT